MFRTKMPKKALSDSCLQKVYFNILHSHLNTCINNLNQNIDKQCELENLCGAWYSSSSSALNINRRSGVQVNDHALG